MIGAGYFLKLEPPALWPASNRGAAPELLSCDGVFAFAAMETAWSEVEAILVGPISLVGIAYLQDQLVLA